MRQVIKPHPLGRNMLTKLCKLCGREFEKDKRTSTKHFNEITVYCSRKCLDDSKLGNTFRRGKPHNNTWNKGKKGLQIAWNKGKGDYAKKLGFGKWMLGKKASLESRRKQSESQKRRVVEGKSNFYIDGRTPKNKAIRGSVEFKIWKDSVFRRDDYRCQECGARSGNGKKIYLHAHHIKPFAYYPELRFDINNGQTLCKECHKKTDSFAWKAIKNASKHSTQFHPSASPN